MKRSTPLDDKNEAYAWDVTKMILYSWKVAFIFHYDSANKMKDDIVKVMFAYAFNLSNTFKRTNFRNTLEQIIVVKPLLNTKNSNRE